MGVGVSHERGTPVQGATASATGNGVRNKTVSVTKRNGSKPVRLLGGPRAPTLHLLPGGDSGLFVHVRKRPGNVVSVLDLPKDFMVSNCLVISLLLLSYHVHVEC